MYSGWFWLLSSNTTSEMDSSNVNVTSGPILFFEPVNIFEKMFNYSSNGSQEFMYGREHSWVIVIKRKPFATLTHK